MKIRHILSFLCVLLLFSLGTESQVRVKIGDGVRMKIAGFGADRITDGELEAWTTPTNLTNWAEGIGGTSTVNREGATQFSGIYCLRCDVDGANGQCSINTPGGSLISLVAGKRYKISFYYKATGGGTLQSIFNDAAGTIYLNTSGEWQSGWRNYTGSLTNANWTEYEVEIITPSTGGYKISFLRSSCANQSFYIDQASVRETPAKVFIGRLANELYDLIGFKTPWLEGDNLLEAKT